MNKKSISSSPLLLFTFSCLCALALSLPHSAFAQAGYGGGIGIGGQNSGTVAFSGRGATGLTTGSVVSNYCWFATSAAPAGAPRVTCLDACTDLTNALLSYYISTNSTAISNAGPINTNVFLCDTTGFATNDFVILRTAAVDSYQLLVVSNVSASALSMYGTATNAPAVGDTIYKYTRASSFAPAFGGGQSVYNYGAAAPGGTFTGPEGKPLVIIITGSNACSLNCVAGDYYRRSRF